MRILVNEAYRIERAQHLQATPYERSAQRVDYANSYKDKTVLTRMGEVTFEVLELTPFHGHLMVKTEGVRDEQIPNGVRAGVPPATY